MGWEVEAVGVLALARRVGRDQRGELGLPRLHALRVGLRARRHGEQLAGRVGAKGDGAVEVCGEHARRRAQRSHPGHLLEEGDLEAHRAAVRVGRLPSVERVDEGVEEGLSRARELLELGRGVRLDPLGVRRRLGLHGSKLLPQVRVEPHARRRRREEHAERASGRRRRRQQVAVLSRRPHRLHGANIVDAPLGRRGRVPVAFLLDAFDEGGDERSERGAHVRWQPLLCARVRVGERGEEEVILRHVRAEGGRWQRARG